MMIDLDRLEQDLNAIAGDLIQVTRRQFDELIAECREGQDARRRLKRARTLGDFKLRTSGEAA